jgi:hypothetical protein
MLLNAVEKALMNNPVRAAIQRGLEARQLLDMGGPVTGGFALEMGCGRGVGTELLFDRFGVARVDAFDLDPHMVALATQRLQARAARVFVGDAARIDAADATYDAVFDFAIIHHVPDWREAIGEAFRVLKPGGRFYARRCWLASSTTRCGGECSIIRWWIASTARSSPRVSNGRAFACSRAANGWGSSRGSWQSVPVASELWRHYASARRRRPSMLLRLHEGVGIGIRKVRPTKERAPHPQQGGK